MPGIGLPEILIVLVIVLVIFGPKRLPDLGRSLGTGMREFKDSVTGKSRDEELPAGDEQPQPQPEPEPEPAREPEPEPARGEKSEATPAGGQRS